MSFGVPFGAHSAYHSDAWKPGSPASSVVGIFGTDESRAVPVTAKGLTLPLPSSARKFDAGSIMKSICSASRSCIAGALPR